MICAVKGFTLENLAILHQFFTSNKNMAVVLALEMMMSSGLTRSDLSPFIWPSAHEEKYWGIVRSEMEGQAMWPNVDVVSRNDAVADVLRLICLLEAFHLMYTKPDGSYVMAVIASSSSQTLPEAAYCDEHSMFKVQLFYNILPQGFLSHAIVRCRKSAQHVDFNQSMAVIYDQGRKALVSVVNVKDPAAVLPANVVQQGKQGFGENK